METLKNPSTNAIALGALTAIWVQVFSGRATVWAAIVDSASVLETRRERVAAEPKPVADVKAGVYAPDEPVRVFRRAARR